MTRWRWLVLLTLVAAPFGACGPNHRPEGPCDGPSFNLVVTTETGIALPPDTRINVRYGGNPDGEPYELGRPRTPQAVSCVEDTSPGGAPSTDAQPAAVEGGQGGAPSTGNVTDDAGVVALRCGLYTQGPARLDVTASGYEPIKDRELSFDGKQRCEVAEPVVLAPLKADAGT